MIIRISCIVKKKIRDKIKFVIGYRNIPLKSNKINKNY